MDLWIYGSSGLPLYQALSINTGLSIRTKKEHKAVRLLGHRASPSTPHRNSPNRYGTTPERVSRWADRSQKLATEHAQADPGAGGGPQDPDTPARSEERRVGKECVRTGRARGSRE